jgi:predicted PurR-regulated permease PerM
MENAKDLKINKYFFLSIIILFAVFLFSSLIQFVSAFLGAIMLYVLSKSFACWLIKKGWSKSMTSILIIIISFFVILLPIAGLVSLLYNKISAVLAHPTIITDAIKQVDVVIQKRFQIDLISNDTIRSIQAFASSILSAVLTQSFNFVTTILMMYFFLYYMHQNINRMEAAIVFYLPFKKDKIKLFGDELVQQTFSNSIGIPAICIAQGLAGFLCYWIAGMEQAGFWGVVTGFAALIPVVGTGLVWAPAAVYLFIIGHIWLAIFVILFGALIMGTLDNIIRFILAKKMADVHPIITVLGVILGLKYFGFLGLIFGPLLISYFIILLKIYYVEYQQPILQRPGKKRQIMPVYMQPFLGFKKTKKRTQAKTHHSKPAD